MKPQANNGWIQAVPPPTAHSVSALATETVFDSAVRDAMLRDHIVFATNVETVRKTCLKVGDDLMLDQARHFALTYEHTHQQLKLLNGYTQSVKGAGVYLFNFKWNRHVSGVLMPP